MTYISFSQWVEGNRKWDVMMPWPCAFNMGLGNQLSYAYLLSCQQLNEQVGTTLMSEFLGLTDNAIAMHCNLICAISV